MIGFDAKDRIEELYSAGDFFGHSGCDDSDGLRGETYTDAMRPSNSKHGLAKRLSSSFLMMLNMLGPAFGIGLGASNASAQRVVEFKPPAQATMSSSIPAYMARVQQTNGYIPVQWCPPKDFSEPSEPFYYKLFAIRQDKIEPMIIANVPSSILRYNFTNLLPGAIYEVKAQICVVDQNGSERCSADSNKPLGVARIRGNSYLDDNTNAVNGIDAALCYSVYWGTNKNPDNKQKCDFDGDGEVTPNDLSAFSSRGGTFGRVQANPFVNTYVYCGDGRCPDTDDCGEVPYGFSDRTQSAALGKLNLGLPSYGNSAGGKGTASLHGDKSARASSSTSTRSLEKPSFSAGYAKFVSKTNYNNFGTGQFNSMTAPFDNNRFSLPSYTPLKRFK